MKRIIHIVFRIAGILVLLLLVFMVLLQTPKGKELAASLLSAAASRSENVEVHIGRINGWIPVSLRVEQVEIGDAEGTWLTLDNLRGRWMMKDLFAGRIRLANLGADEVELSRLPAPGNGKKGKSRDTGWISDMEIVLEGWSVDRLKLGPALVGMPLEYAVSSGGITLIDGALTGDLAISGDADGSVTVTTDFANTTNRSLVLRARLEDMRKPNFGLDRLSGGVDATITAQGIAAVISAEIAKDGIAGHVASRLHYAAGKLHLGDFKFEGNGISTEGNIDLSFARDRVDLDVDARLTDRGQHRYSLAGAATVGTSNRTWTVSVPSLSFRAWDTIELSVAGNVTPRKIDLTARLAEFELGALPYSVASNLTGRVSGALSVRGIPESPQVTSSVKVSGFTSSSKALDELPKLDFLIAGGISDGRLSASVSLTNRVSGYLEAAASLPCSASLVPLRFEADYGRIDGALDAFLDLDAFNGLAMLENQYVKGLLTAELNVSESIPSGFAYIENGTYEHFAWGILFKEFNGRLEVTPEGLIVRNAHATDGGDGEVVLSGGMSKDMLDVSVELKQARIIQRPEIEAVISGRLGLSGPYSHPALKGRLVVDRADLLPDSIVSSAPAVLEDFDIEQQPVSKASTKRRRAFPIGMDVKLDMPDQVYINASLINSVWGGALWLRDSPDGLWIKGGIEPRRGYVNFIGKQFRLLDGSLEMDSAVHSVPVMNNLTAEYSRSDITARLVLNGSVVNPLFRLESTPALPEDEILSQVLFKRDASTISPYQAVQIALAAKQLSGGLSGPGFMYEFRQAVGVDTLEWREPESEDAGSSVAAGKYLTPDLYVEVSSTFGAEAQTDMTAEYEITRHISVETSAGPKLRPGIGLNWKYDY